MKNLARVVFFVILMISLAGCGGGGAGNFFSALGDALSSGFSSGGSSSGGDSFASGSGGSSGGSGTQVALVHQPEPATMLLWGIGLAGAALLKRKKSKKS